MTIPKVKELKIDTTSNRNLERSVQQGISNVVDVVNTVSQVAVVNGRLLEQEVIINKDIFVEHKLGRPYRGFSVFGSDNGIKAWESPTVNKQPDKFLILQCSNTGTVNLWVI